MLDGGGYSGRGIDCFSSSLALLYFSSNQRAASRPLKVGSVDAGMGMACAERLAPRQNKRVLGRLHLHNSRQQTYLTADSAQVDVANYLRSVIGQATSFTLAKMSNIGTSCGCCCLVGVPMASETCFFFLDTPKKMWGGGGGFLFPGCKTAKHTTDRNSLPPLVVSGDNQVTYLDWVMKPDALSQISGPMFF